MMKAGALEDPSPGAIFGLHAIPSYRAGQLALRSGGAMASADFLRIVVHGRQTHAAYPWEGVDPIVAAAQIVLGLQTIPSRQLDLTRAPAVVTIGRISGGVRGNIIPDQVELVGTIRALDADMRADIHARVKHTAETIAQSAGATAEVETYLGLPITYNDPALVRQMTPTLRRVAGADHLLTGVPPIMGAEDFSLYQEQIPGLYLWLGVSPPGEERAAPLHSPRFRIDEGALILGVRALAHLAVDYLHQSE